MTNNIKIIIGTLILVICGLVYYQFNYLVERNKKQEFMIETPAGNIQGSFELNEQ